MRDTNSNDNRVWPITPQANKLWDFKRLGHSFEMDSIVMKDVRLGGALSGTDRKLSISSIGLLVKECIIDEQFCLKAWITPLNKTQLE